MIELILLINTLFVAFLYFWKIFLAHKLLRIEQDGELNQDEDYFLSLLSNKDNFMLKVNCGSLKKISGKLQIEESIKLRDRINKLIDLILKSLIVLLILTIMYHY